MEFYKQFLPLAIPFGLLALTIVLLFLGRTTRKLIRLAGGTVRLGVAVLIIIVILLFLGLVNLAASPLPNIPPLFPAATATATPVSRPTARPATEATQGLDMPAGMGAVANDLRDYFQMVSEHNLSGGLMRLSQKFLDNHFPRSHDGSYDFSSYLNWWNRVQQVEVGTVTVEEDNDREAIVTAELKYYMANGQELVENHRFRLARPNHSAIWLIDDESKL